MESGQDGSPDITIWTLEFCFYSVGFLQTMYGMSVDIFIYQDN